MSFPQDAALIWPILFRIPPPAPILPPAASGPTPLLIASLHAPARNLGPPQPGKTTAP